MAIILNIESSSNICSAALSINGELSQLRESDTEKSHAGKLTVFIEEILKSNNISTYDLDAIAISKGPGSYTGLRIGVSVAKGICYAMNKPLIAVDTLKSLTLSMLLQSGSKISGNNSIKDFLFCPMIDARRIEVYTAFYDFDLNAIDEVKSIIIETNSFKEILDKQKIIFFGNGADKCKDLIKHKNAEFIDNIELSARYMCSLAEESFNNKDFADTAYFEPFYLKDFIATTPKKNLLTNES